MALEGIAAAPGVVRGAHERLWWAFDTDAVRSAIRVADEDCGEQEPESPPSRPNGRREREVEELQGFLTRYALCVEKLKLPRFDAVRRSAQRWAGSWPG